MLVATSPIEFRNGLDGLVILLHETLLHETLGMIRSAGRVLCSGSCRLIRFLTVRNSGGVRPISRSDEISLKLESSELFGLPPQY